MHFVLSNVGLFKGIVECVGKIVDEAQFTFSPDKVELRAIDPIRICMVDLVLPKGVFEEYECKEPLKVGINFENLGKIMDRAIKTTNMELSYEEKKPVTIIFNAVGRKVFTLPALDLRIDELPVPRIESTVSIKLLSSIIDESVKDMAIVGDTMKIEVNDTGVLIHTSGDENFAKIELKKGSEGLLDLEVKEVTSCIYALSYLTEISRASNISEVATLTFKTGMPLQVVFQFGEGRLTYYLAPRRETE